MLDSCPVLSLCTDMPYPSSLRCSLLSLCLCECSIGFAVFATVFSTFAVLPPACLIVVVFFCQIDTIALLAALCNCVLSLYYYPY